MLKKHLVSLLAISVAIVTTSTRANIDTRSIVITTPAQIEQEPAVHFPSEDTRANNSLIKNRDFSFVAGSVNNLYTKPAVTRGLFSTKTTFDAEVTVDEVTEEVVVQTPAERTGCPELMLNSAMYTAFTAEGQTQCYSVEVLEETKIEGVLVDIPAEVNYNLFFFKLEDDNSFSLLDSSITTATTEQTFVKVNPGIYVIAAQSTQGVSATQAIMGWFAYTDFDQYESNDKFSQATPLSSLSTINGNIDNPNDIDFFSYQTGAEQQKIKVKFTGSEQFTFELWTGSAWANITSGQVFTIDVVANSSVNFVARATSGNVPEVSAQYSFTIIDPEAATTITNTKDWNDENLTDAVSYRYTEAFSRLSVSGQIVDDNGQGVPWASVVVTTWGASAEVMSQEVEVTDSSGRFSRTMTIPTCSGSERAYYQSGPTSGVPGNPEYFWEIRYDAAAYSIDLIGSDNTSIAKKTESFIHICDEDIIKYCYWDTNYNTGVRTYKCFPG